MTIATASGEAIRIRGARTHNLQNVDLDIPRDSLVVLTGPSGSGKSSLAFDTLFAEGQRQYIESLSTYARQFLNQLERPDVDLIDGLEPTICIDQRAGQQGPRSTVGTVTEIYDFLRLLYARVGSVACHSCGEPIQQQSQEQIQKLLTSLPEGTKLMILAPVVRGRKGEQQEAIGSIRKAGFVRVRLDGELVDVDQLPPLDAKKSHSIDAVVDRIVLRGGIEGRLAEALQLAIKHGDGVVLGLWLEPQHEQMARERGESTEKLWQERLFSTQYACPACGLAYPEIEPRTFSFNSPYGACPTCEGLGSRVEFDPESVIAFPDKPVAKALAFEKELSTAAVKALRKSLEDCLAQKKVDVTTAWQKLPTDVQHELLRGSGADFLGILLWLEKRYATATEDEERKFLESLRGPVECPDCHGDRLCPEARAVRIAGRSLPAVMRSPLSAARQFFASLSWQPHEEPIGRPIVAEVLSRLAFLELVGLTYLTLDRPADSLSGGELQRVRLATGIGSGLVGVCYILDEPSIGLHPRDTERLIRALRDLQSQGNTVIVVEHDEALMRAADWLIDMGPGAGSDGGRIMAEGTPAEVMRSEQSLTGGYLSGRIQLELPPSRRPPTKEKIVLRGASMHNLQQVTAEIPLGLFVCVTGVSGSGKSSLINETLAPALLRRLGAGGRKPGPFQELLGAELLDQVVIVDQSPLGRSPRSNPATYCGIFDEIRKVFTATKMAKQLGFKAPRFSFNATEGRCEECRGHGVKRIEMNFLPDITVPCPVCHGTRFNRQTLEVTYKGLNIAQVLQLRCGEAAEFFRELEPIYRPLATMCEVGLAYLPIGQAATTLSGGESQRIKLATELAQRERGKVLYILDEPTTGLHRDDVRRLIAVLQQLVDKGHTVLVVEHHLDVMRSADWLIDLGPDGGSGGGRIVATGPPEELAQIEDNLTAAALRNDSA